MVDYHPKPRFLSEQLIAALEDTPVVFLRGARQTGKSTLACQIGESVSPRRYVTLDDAVVLAAAREDPVGFLAGLSGPVTLDEVQRAPDLFPAIKAEVDRSRRPGRFLLTGSANVLLLPRLAESLAGRMEILTLWPFSQGEIRGGREHFIDRLFAGEPPPAAGPSEAARIVLTGGYPPAVERTSPDRRRAWFGSYLTAILERDVRDLAHIEGLTTLPRVLALLAARTASLVNFAELSRGLGMPQTTLKRYMALLEATFLVSFVPAWSSNLGKRLIRTPKLFLNDTGMAGYLLGADEERLGREPALRGAVMENFAVMELRKQAGWSKARPELFHYRTAGGQEVDLVLENAAGEIVGIEVKASATVTGHDFRGLRALMETAGDRFRGGAVLYTGTSSVPFGPRLHAVPVASLWGE